MVDIKVIQVKIIWKQSLIDISRKSAKLDRAITKIRTDEARQVVESAVNRWIYENEGDVQDA